MKQGITVPVRKPGENEEAFFERVQRWAMDDTARSKGDNKEWTGSLPFHLDKPTSPSADD